MRDQDFPVINWVNKRPGLNQGQKGKGSQERGENRQPGRRRKETRSRGAIIWLKKQIMDLQKDCIRLLRQIR